MARTPGVTTWPRASARATYASLADVPAPTLRGDGRLVTLYRRSLAATAKAGLIEKSRDVDLTGRGDRKGGAAPRVVFMKSWVREGALFTGFDTEGGGILNFFWDKVAKRLPVEAAEQNAGAGKFRRRGGVRRSAMFRKLRNSKSLRADATDTEAWIRFTGRAADIACVSQEGLTGRPTLKAKPV